MEGDVAVLPKNGDNDVKARVVKETVELSRECAVLKFPRRSLIDG